MDPIDVETCIKALATRDPRFDGHFVVAVRSTRIYCRPVCRSRAPDPRHCRFLASAAAAEREGFRPCLRCRPELAPRVRATTARQRLALAAAQWIDVDGLPDDPTALAALAGSLASRVDELLPAFVEHFDATPLDYARTRSALWAKQLLADTDLPLAQVARLAGFGSEQALVTALRDRYRLAPDALRRPRSSGKSEALRRAQPTSSPDGLRLRLAYRLPYDWPYVETFLSRRSIDDVEAVDGDGYRRVVALPDRAVTGWLAVRPLPSVHVGAMQVELSMSLVDHLPECLQRLRWLLDLDAMPDQVASVLGALATDQHGVRLPGAFEGFELAVRAILGQQITVKAARTLASRFVARFGAPVATPFADLSRAFPPPAVIAAADVDAIASLGIIASRARSIIALAQSISEGRLRLDPLQPVDTTVAALRALPGIGDWTAQYIAMRALGWADAFPAGDLIVRRAMGVETAAQAAAGAAGWQPWRGYAVMHLWKRGLPPVTPAVAARAGDQVL